MSKVQWMNLCFPCLCISLVVDSKQLDGGGPHRCFCWCKQIWAALMLHLSRSSAGHQRRFKWHDTCHEESQKSNTCTFTYHLPITSYMCMCIYIYISIHTYTILQHQRSCILALQTFSTERSSFTSLNLSWLYSHGHMVAVSKLPKPETCHHAVFCSEPSSSALRHPRLNRLKVLTTLDSLHDSRATLPVQTFDNSPALLGILRALCPSL